MKAKKAREKILTKHPLGKRGVNISKEKYDAGEEGDPLGVAEKGTHARRIVHRLNKSLQNKFSGSINWYAETVKLDLEARELVERTSSKPQKYRLK